MDYHILREIADSWVLLAMFVFFIGVIVWALRPGSNRQHRDVANSIFRNDDQPANSEEAQP
ncbi:cbb3-type cytochrome oxidase subunit 3 [Celeribacter sp.]|uniref:cbb3-type cytochrome oxidase subunit 3 n=1 Tax=Celeribacter sp. TaxID=1890673 RepID=UPI003A90A893